MKSILKVVPALAAALALASSVMASPITGAVTIAGTVTLDAGLLTASKVTSFDSALVTAVKPGSVLDLFINPGNLPTMAATWTLNSGQSALWSVGGFTFDLNSAVIHTPRSSTLLDVTGLGMLKGNGYEPTAGSWTFQANTDFGSYEFGFTSGSTALPDGGTTAMLLGLGLTGMALFARARRLIA